MNSLPLANDGNTKSSLEDRVMSRINHTRPILQMIDDIKRHRTESAAAYRRPQQKLFPSIVENLLTGEDAEF